MHRTDEAKAPTLTMEAVVRDAAGKDIGFRERGRADPPPHVIIDTIAEFAEASVRQLISHHMGSWREMEITIRRS